MLPPSSDEDEARAITRLVDGSLSDAERSAVETWANERPEVRQRVALQRRVASELRAGGPSVPTGLTERVQRSSSRRVRWGRGRPATLPRRGGTRPATLPRAALAGAVAVLAAAALVVGLQIGTGGAGTAPSIPAAAQLAYASATQPAPAAKTSTLLDVSYAGITYPNYAARFGAIPTGQRLDHLGGRAALTVFYRLRDGSRLSYTVFSGKPVPLPQAARVVVFDGVPLRVYSTRSGLAVVTLVRFGRTCVLAAPTGRDIVLALAAAPVRAQAV